MENYKIVEIIKKILIKTGVSKRFEYYNYYRILHNKEYGLILLNLMLKEVHKYKKDILDDNYYVLMLRLKMQYNSLSPKRKRVFIKSRRTHTLNKLLSAEKYIKILIEDKTKKTGKIIELMKKTMISREVKQKNIRGFYKKNGFEQYELPIIKDIINQVELNASKSIDFLLIYTKTKMSYLSIKDQEQRCNFVESTKKELLTNLKQLKKEVNLYEQVIINKKNRASTTL